MATAAQVAEYREANRSLVSLAQRDLRDFWGSLNLFGDPAKVRAALLEFYPELLALYGDAAALLGADWYDMLRDVPPSASRFRAALAAPVDVDQARGSARWALGPLFEDADSDGALSLLLGSTQRLVLQPGRESTWTAARSDPVRTSFARVPSGPTTCKWCVMLASRGFAYDTAQSASQARHFHDNCNCVIIPGRDESDLPDGYDLAEMKQLYSEMSGIGRDIPTD